MTNNVQKKNKNEHTFRAFRNRNYSLFFTGQSISQIGTWMQRTAVIWVIYSLTHSASMIGFAVFAQQFPAFLFSLFGGVIADRYPRYKILLVTQTASMIQAILLAALILTNHYVIWEMLTLSAILGTINAFDVPARQPMVHEMVDDKADLANAISLNSAMVNLARLIGPALSGMVLQKFGAGVCFVVNAVSFIAVIISLLLMKFPEFKLPAVKKKVTSELAEGLKYLKQTPAISMLILLMLCLSLLILPYDTMEPVFAKVIFKGNAATYGYISGCIGLGALIGSFLLASAKKGINLKMVLILSIATLGMGLILFSRTSYFALALPCAVILGLGSITPMSTSITIIQMEAAANMRGRVMSFVAMAYFGMIPLGSLLIGTISQKLGAPLTMLCQGIAALVIAVCFSVILKSDRQELKEKNHSII
ncbi:Predicted arabinose efflux permease, MFS family [Mucilaginibacter lappiensis]|uniref:MFS family permease n=1 Tax=Mucilaginibacter lappiensis TaxID=354630 RepID=A0ABR6PLG7_9SPHI|nr:MFS transporter [Mucilaginibacter lappiensis]MBB6110612.1 MFS family permease [Mucilaginibacter lappiensis]SIR43027.1 Predicted arabinose efflux permease, MFS family [Mucilaginibacter lappiensis]